MVKVTGNLKRTCETVKLLAKYETEAKRISYSYNIIPTTTLKRNDLMMRNAKVITEKPPKLSYISA